MSDKGVCRTAPATPGLLVSISGTSLFATSVHLKLLGFDHIFQISLHDLLDTAGQFRAQSLHERNSDVLYSYRSRLLVVSIY